MTRKILRIIWNEINERLKRAAVLISYFTFAGLIMYIIMLPFKSISDFSGIELVVITAAVSGMLGSAYFHGFLFHIADALKYSEKHNVELEEAWEKTKVLDDSEP